MIPLHKTTADKLYVKWSRSYSNRRWFYPKWPDRALQTERAGLARPL